MGPPISAFPFVPSGDIASEAAIKAACDLKRQKNSSGRVSVTSRNDEYRLQRRSRKMAKEFTEHMEKNVKKKLENLSGSQNNRKLGLKVAQFIPGKGLEVPGAHVENDPAVYCSLGLKGESRVDPLGETFKQIKGRQVSMDFAFKLINDRDGLLTHDKKTRVTVMNCFRHVNPDPFNNHVTGWHETIDPAASDAADKMKSNQKWNTTLGPDASLIRRGTGGKDAADPGVSCGTWRGVDGDNVHDATGSYANPVDADANTLMSPYRYPNDMEVMYSRINRQLLENYGWLLNPYKFVQWQDNANTEFGISTVDVGHLKSWTNPGVELLDFTRSVSDTTQENKKRSFPCQVNTQDTLGTFDWHSQFGPGKLSYQFQNDGTNPVCIDICVVGIKKDSPVPVALLHNFCKYNYAVHKFANKGKTDLNGFQSNAAGSFQESFGQEEWHDNAKMPFMPDACFKNPSSYNNAANLFEGYPASETLYRDIVANLEQGQKNPFKVVKRDQFIVSSGASRAWSTTLPSIKYRPQLYEDVEYPLEPYTTPGNDLLLDNFETTADEYTFVLCIGASGLPKPVEEVLQRFHAGADIVHETGTTTPDSHNVDAKAIIDRQPTTCNVSVVGTYKETIYPTYPVDKTSVNFINGRLTEPYFTSEPGRYLESAWQMRKQAVNTVDIATIGQVVQVADNGVLGVGAITTEKGA